MAHRRHRAHRQPSDQPAQRTAALEPVATGDAKRRRLRELVAAPYRHRGLCRDDGGWGVDATTQKEGALKHWHTNRLHRLLINPSSRRAAFSGSVPSGGRRRVTRESTRPLHLWQLKSLADSASSTHLASANDRHRRASDLDGCGDAVPRKPSRYPSGHLGLDQPGPPLHRHRQSFGPVVRCRRVLPHSFKRERR